MNIYGKNIYRQKFRAISFWIVKTKKNIFCESIGIEKGPLHYWTSTGSQLAINSTRQIKTHWNIYQFDKKWKS